MRHCRRRTVIVDSWRTATKQAVGRATATATIITATVSIININNNSTNTHTGEKNGSVTCRTSCRQGA